MPRADDLRRLHRAGRRHATAKAKLAEVEEERDAVITAVYVEGNLSMREIAKAAGLSFQRVSQILAKAE